EEKGRAWTGCGVVLDVRRRLIVTTAHMVAPKGSLRAFFPVWDKEGKLINDKRYYERLRDDGKGCTASVLKGDMERDLAIIHLESPLPVNAVAIKVAPKPALPGARLVLVGNPGASNGRWRFSTGKVQNRVPEVRTTEELTGPKGERLPTERVLLRAWCLESDVPTGPGDSGCPIVNGKGQLVGIH